MFQTSRRPIIFVGYSLGGLLVKEVGPTVTLPVEPGTDPSTQAIVQAHRKSKDSSNLDLCKACCGMLFFGVPNLGLRHEQLRSITEGQSNKILVNDLIVDGDTETSNFLKRLSEQFSDCCKSMYKVISFYELKHSPTVEVGCGPGTRDMLLMSAQTQPDGTLLKTGPKCLMVTEKSATSTGLVAVADEDNIPFNTDHTGLVKYDSQEHGLYPIVKERLKSLVDGEAPRAAQRFAETCT